MVFFVFLMHEFRSNAITLKWLGAILARRLTRSRPENHVTSAISLRGQVAALGEDSLKRQLARTGKSYEKSEGGGMKGTVSRHSKKAANLKELDPADLCSRTWLRWVPTWRSADSNDASYMRRRLSALKIASLHTPRKDRPAENHFVRDSGDSIGW